MFYLLLAYNRVQLRNILLETDYVQVNISILCTYLARKLFLQ